MTTEKLSINKAFLAICVFLVLFSMSMIIMLYQLTGNSNVILCGFFFTTILFFALLTFLLLLRKKLIIFSNSLCSLLDQMMTEEMESPQIVEEESIFYKINHHLVRLYEVMRENRRSITKERADLQELISDISHQVKTPIANLKMVHTTLLEQSMPREKQQEFLLACAGQLDQLDFLMQAMIKTSRLETGVITLEKKKQSIYETLASALGGILLSAEQKHISVDVDCNENLLVAHDRKWTSEALFNLLDNAVKYTQDSGNIYVSADKLELYLRIDISDTGKGISENHQAKIFKRFYREEEVHDIDGVGIGLYLAREIITMQGGYIKVLSELGQGSTFSVFLPHE